MPIPFPRSRYELPLMPRMDTPEKVLQYAATCAEAADLANWHFELTNRYTSRLGTCQPRGLRIVFSRRFVEQCLPWPSPYLRELILHELAHALAYIFYRAGGHGRPWRRMCAALGLPNARATISLPPDLRCAVSPRMPPRYVLCHDESGEVYRLYRRIPLGLASTLHYRYIKGRKEETLHHLVLRPYTPENAADE